MSRKKKFFTEGKIAFLARWWSAGAVYFFIAWGTTIGESEYGYLDLALVLGVFIGLFFMLVVNPILRSMFNLRAEIEYKSSSVLQLVLYRLGEILKSTIIVVLIVIITSAINIGLISILQLPEDSVPFPGEPITFGLMYVLLYMLSMKLKQLFKKIISKD
jgi:hypothetical protein